MKMGLCMLIRDFKNPSVCTNLNVGNRMHRLIHDRTTRSVCTIMCTILDPEISHDVPYSIGKTAKEQPLNHCKNSCLRGDRSEFRSEAAHSDRGGRCPECHKVVKIGPKSLLADALEDSCNCASKLNDIEPRIVKGTIVHDFKVYPNQKCKISYCIGDTVCRNYIDHQVTIPGEALVKCWVA